VKVRRFDTDNDLIVVKARVVGRHGSRRLALALDTTASHTHITPDIIDELGYSPAEEEAITSVRSVVPYAAGTTRVATYWRFNGRRSESLQDRAKRLKGNRLALAYRRHRLVERGLIALLELDLWLGLINHEV
jgi:hypothetical protein